jgi:hypothetical protein
MCKKLNEQIQRGGGNPFLIHGYTCVLQSFCIQQRFCAQLHLRSLAVFNAHSFLPQDSPDPNPKIFSSAIRCKATKRTQTSKKDSETLVEAYRIGGEFVPPNLGRFKGFLP